MPSCFIGIWELQQEVCLKDRNKELFEAPKVEPSRSAEHYSRLNVQARSYGSVRAENSPRA